jgi:integrase
MDRSRPTARTTAASASTDYLNGPHKRSQRSPARLDTRLLFPAERDGYINLDWFRRNEWTPAVKAAGLPGRTPYALRHTYAGWSIAAGIGPFELSRLMGSSVEQIDRPTVICSRIRSTGYGPH